MDLKKILPLFSYVFHPIFISVYAALFYFFVTKGFYYPHEVYLTLLQVAILTLFLPLSMYYLLKSLGLARSGIMLFEKRERRLPLSFQAMFFLVLTQHGLSNVVVPELYYFFLGALASTVLALLLVMFHFKVSIHMIGVAGLALFVAGISLHYNIPFINLIAFSIVMSGFVASSRLYMKAHTFTEVVVGVLVGALPQLALWYFWL